MKQLITRRSQNNEIINAIEFNDLSASFTLSLDANVQQSITVDPFAFLARFNFSSGSDVFVSPTTISIPTGGTNANSEAEINPNVRILIDGQGNQITTLFFLSSVTAVAQVFFYNQTNNT